MLWKSNQACVNDVAMIGWGNDYLIIRWLSLWLVSWWHDGPERGDRDHVGGYVTRGRHASLTYISSIGRLSRMMLR